MLKELARHGRTAFSRLCCLLAFHQIFNDWPNGDGFCIYCRTWFDHVDGGID